MRLLARILDRPRIDADSFAGEKNIMETELLLNDSDWNAKWRNAIVNAANPYYVPTFDERLASVPRISIDDVQTFTDRHYHAGNMTAVFSGPVSSRTADRMLKRYFTPSDRSLPSGKPQQDTKRPNCNFVNQPGSLKTAVAAGVLVETCDDPATRAAAMVAGMYLRLLGNRYLRGDQKLVYEAQGSLFLDFNKHSLSVGALVKAENGPQLVQGITDLVRMAASETDDNILKRAKRYAKGIYYHGIELGPAAQSNMATFCYYLSRIGSFEEPKTDYTDYLDQVTGEDVRAAIHDHFIAGDLYYAAMGRTDILPSFKEFKALLGRPPETALPPPDVKPA